MSPPRLTATQWLGLAARWLGLIDEHMRTGVLGGGDVQADATPIKYLVPGHGKIKLGNFWTCARPGGDTVFRWETSRAAACLKDIVPADFRGTLQSDGYSAYPAFVRGHNARTGSEAIVLAGCWAHARRALHEALVNDPRTVAWLLRQIAHLHQVEADLRRTCRAEANWLVIVRAAHRAPILRRLHTALARLRPRHVPQSALGNAITYCLEQWAGLAFFV